MPIDASVYDRLGQQPQGINQPFANLQQVMNLRQQQQVNASLEQERQSRAAETQQQTIKLQQQQQDQQDFAESLQKGNGIRAATMDYALKNHPKVAPDIQKYFDTTEESANKIQQQKVDLQKAQMGIQNAQLDHIGHAAEGLLNLNLPDDQLPGAVQLALAHHAELFPDEAPQVKQYAQQLQQATPQQAKAFLQGLMQQAPYKQAATAELNKPLVVPEGGSVEAGGKIVASGTPKPGDVQTQRQLDASLLASAANPTDYAAKLAQLPADRQAAFPSAAAWASTPQVRNHILQIGMSPDQQVTTGLTAAGQYETGRHDLAMEALQDPSNPKRQDALEQQYRGVLAKEFSSRSGGLGLEDKKVNQAIHLTALLDQNRDPATGAYNIPKAQFAELASGLASLVSPTGQPTDSMRSEIETRTAKGDFNGVLTYLTGTPFNGSTQDMYQMLRDSITRQGNVAQGNRQTYFNAISAQAPTDLAPDRKAKLDQALQLNTMPSDTVQMRSPDGQVKPIPRYQVDYYKKQGATVVGGGQ